MNEWVNGWMNEWKLASRRFECDKGEVDRRRLYVPIGMGIYCAWACKSTLVHVGVIEDLGVLWWKKKNSSWNNMQSYWLVSCVKVQWLSLSSPQNHMTWSQWSIFGPWFNRVTNLWRGLRESRWYWDDILFNWSSVYLHRSMTQAYYEGKLYSVLVWDKTMAST